MKNVKGNVEALITPIIEDLGYELVEVEYIKKYDSMYLIVYIDKQGGIMLSDCELVHKAIDGPLDDLDPTEGQPYIMNVSSPGLDRPLKNDKDYKRNQYKAIEISFYSPFNGKKKIEGILQEWTEETITIDVQGEMTTLTKKDIAIIRPVI